SVGGVAPGRVLSLTGWLYIDPLRSRASGGLIAFSAWRIVREAVNMLMEGTPPDIDLVAVSGEIAGTDHVTGVHDLHVWALSSDETALSCHVVIDDISLGAAEHVVRALAGRLCGR